MGAKSIAEYEAQVMELVEKLGEEKVRVIRLIGERNHWESEAKRRWALRMEMEQLVGMKEGETYQEVAFLLALKKIRRWKKVYDLWVAWGKRGNVKR